MTTPADATTADPDHRLGPVLDLGHDLLVVVLILWRVTAPAINPVVDACYWSLLPVLGWLFCCFEAALGRRPGLRWNLGLGPWLGVLALLVPACLLRPHYPAQAWHYWLDWLAVVLACGYLFQVLPGRQRLAVAALVGAILLECLLAWGQAIYVLPTLAEMQNDGKLAPGASALMQADLVDRIQHGGVYATFTLANGLAMVLLLAAIPLVGALWRRAQDGQDRRVLAAAAMVLLAIAITWYLTGAKGSVAALAIGGAVAWARWGRGRLRWLPAAAMLVVAGVLVAWPALGGASLAVRMGYLEGAWPLIVEAPWTGLGWHAYEDLGQIHMPPQAEFSRYVHNGLIEAWITGGILLPLMLLVGIASCLRWRSSAAEPVLEAAAPRQRHVPWALIAILPYLTLFGTLVSDNLGWWPLPPVLAAALLALPVAAAMVLTLRLPVATPPWFAAAGLIFAIGCLIDFHLQDAALFGSAALVLTMGAAGRARHLAWRPALTAGILIVLAIATALAIWRTYDHLDREAARQEVVVIQQLRSGSTNGNGNGNGNLTWWQALAHPRGLAVEDLAGNPRAARALLDQTIDEIEQRALRTPIDLRLLIQVLPLDGNPQRVHTILARLAEAGHANADLASLQVVNAGKLGAWEQCPELVERAIAWRPHNLRRIQDLVAFLERRVLPQLVGAKAAAVAARIAHWRDYIERYRDRVHFRYRLRDR